jgi:hypothetical protein
MRLLRWIVESVRWAIGRNQVAADVPGKELSLSSKRTFVS